MKLTLFSTKQTFLILVFINLIVQTIITRYSMLKSPKQKNKWYSLLLFICMLMLIFIMCMPIPIFIKFMVFCVFSMLQGYTLASLNINDTVFQFAFYGALSIFCSMIGISALITMLGVKFGSKFGLGLLSTLLLFILIFIFNAITGDISHKLLSAVGVVLFSIFIIYDTNIILQRDYKGDFISASLAYYLDFLNLFIDLSWFNQ